ncbi:MAG: NapC/NirT family cytochrome c [Sulfurovum sp.]|nr:NapC/NirT family cytochrome c [Sulfurovum sp.]
MQMQLDYTPVFSEHTEDSKLCASCHNLETPVIATDGSLTNFTFPEQAAYTEWEYSDFNGTKDTCQNCHMPKAEGSLVISTKGQGVEPRPNFHQHKFLGANTYMLEILKNNRVKLGALADETRFDESITDTREFLKSAAVINIGNTVFLNRTLNFDVNVTNKSGHKFPTGFPSRRVWLHVTVKNTANQIVFESGGFNSEGQIIGVDDTLTANTYEPHYEKINDESQVQVYETILSDTDDNMTYILLHALHYLKDNRILPKGLDKNDINLPETINPHGNAENDSNFIGGSDTVKYEIENLAADNYTITATLYYQTLSYGFAQDLYKNSELPEVALMKLLDANTTNHYETISADSTSIIVP